MKRLRLDLSMPYKPRSVGGELHLSRSPGGILFNREFEDLSGQNRLLDFKRVMSWNESRVVKHAVPERKTVRVSLKDGNSRFQAYLKRYYPLSAARLWAHLLKCMLPKTALYEFKNIAAFHRAGLPTMRPLAAGIRRCGFCRSESFMLTKALENCMPLDLFFAGYSAIPPAQKKELIKRVAVLVKKLHACGFNHRDLYLCHILLNSRGELFLVDLHRAEKREQVPERLKIKDLAALNYSAPSRSFTRTDRLRFLKTYLGVGGFADTEKRLMLKVLKKTEKMIKHNKKRDK